jgi:hypothetical protein
MFAGDLIAVDWYPSLGALVQGLMKNTFAAVGYRVPAVVASVAGMLTVGVLPFAIAVSASGRLQTAALVVSGLQVVAALVATRAAGLPSRYGLGLPFSSVLFSYILVRATVLTLWRGGIYWRGTFYRLEDLRGNRL